MLFKRFSIAAAAIGLAMSFSSQAIETFKPSKELVERTNGLIKQQARSVRYYKLDSGLIALGVESFDFKKMVFYTNETGDFLISGVMIDTENRASISNQVQDKFEIDYTPIVNAMKDTHMITNGNDDSDNQIIAVIDSNCGYCHSLWNEMAKFDNDQFNSQVKVAYLPVGFLGADSDTKASAISGITDNTQAYAALETLMQTRRLPAGVTKTDLGIDNAEKNKNFMQTIREGGVPMVMSKIDGKWTKHYGMPRPDFFRSLEKFNQVASQDSVATTGE